MQTIVTKESIKQMLQNPNPAYVQQVVGRALVAIFNNQTKDEQSDNVTEEQNGIGFTGSDAYSGTMTAKYFLKHRHLQDWQVEKWTKLSKNGMPRLCKYAKQLNEIAKQKHQVCS